MEDLEVLADGRREGDLHHVDRRDLVGPAGLDPSDHLPEFVRGANQFGLDGAIGKVADPSEDLGGAAVVLDMGSKADALDVAPEAGADGLAVSQWRPRSG